MPGNIRPVINARMGIISSVNSSTTPINDGANFTGSWEDVGGFESILVGIETDQDGYFQIEFSPDETNVDESMTKYFRTSRLNVPHLFYVSRQYYRVKFFNNSGTNQTFFRLQTKLGQVPNLSVCGNAPLAQAMGAQNVRPTDFTAEVALGKREGYSSWNMFGSNSDVDTGTEEIIASFGGAFNQKLASAKTLDVSSSSANDTNSSGTGARQIKIYGVDANWDQIEETVNLNGVSTVTTSNTFFGVNRVQVILSGTGLTNEGVVTLAATTSGNTMGEIPAGKGVTQQCLFYVPRACTFLVNWLHINGIKPSGSDPKVNFYLKSHNTTTNTTEQHFHDGFDTAERSVFSDYLPEPIVFEEKEIVWMSADTDANNTEFRGRFSGKLYESPNGG